MTQATKSSERLFIESLPRSVAPRDVVERGKAIGLAIKLKKVYRVRAETASAAPPAAAKAAPKAPQKAAPKVTVTALAPAAADAPAAAATKVSPKAAFILSFPRDAKARDIIAAGAKQGLTVSANYISVVRTGSRKKATKKAPATRKQAAMAAAPVSTVRTTAAAPSNSEKALVGVILDIGLERVAAVVAEVRKKLEALL